jgi:hypothetical protein
MARRSNTEIAAALKARAVQLEADADRRLSVASDAPCSLMWEAEKALRALGAYMGADGGAKWRVYAGELAAEREARWADLKTRGLA